MTNLIRTYANIPPGWRYIVGADIGELTRKHLSKMAVFTLRFIKLYPIYTFYVSVVTLCIQE